MTLSELYETIFEIIEDNIDDDVEINKESLLVKELGLTSMAIMTAIGDMEDEFGIDIPVSAITNVESVEDLVQVIIRLLEEE